MVPDKASFRLAFPVPLLGAATEAGMKKASKNSEDLTAYFAHKLKIPTRKEAAVWRGIKLKRCHIIAGTVKLVSVLHEIAALVDSSAEESLGQLFEKSYADIEKRGGENLEHYLPEISGDDAAEIVCRDLKQILNPNYVPPSLPREFRLFIRHLCSLFVYFEYTLYETPKFNKRTMLKGNRTLIEIKFNIETMMLISEAIFWIFQSLRSADKNIKLRDRKKAMALRVQRRKQEIIELAFQTGNQKPRSKNQIAIQVKATWEKKHAGKEMKVPSLSAIKNYLADEWDRLNLKVIKS